MGVFNRDIRQYLGKGSMVQVMAAAIVMNSQTEVLLLRRPGKEVWGLPIGAIKPGESMEDTAARELWEESGLHADQMKLLDLLSGPDYVKKHANGDKEYFIIGVYAAHGLSSAIDLPSASDVSLKYFNREQLPDMDQLTAHLMSKLAQQSYED
ncbi:NUDIX domain-containing protein [Paenibacillus lemnae]|uniref:NUDIX domain-containing protein n=1 Tax=Paenibacillus lemnae TaxID=1330551 RepID=A0A848M8P3_PAELE|nr:NUDIX domain-containing protein [Paenibacillus lemnae]NMO96263.1 NUDIX domain-containing protein [Paenibacillus lemnae]